MTSALVDVFDYKNQKIKARILLDTCATANFITRDLLNKLKLSTTKCCFSVGALNNLSTTVNSMLKITFKSCYNEYKRTLNFLVVPNITDLVPSQTVKREQLKIPQNILLADPNFHKPDKIDMLIGAGPTLSLFSIGSINLSENSNDLYLQKTRLGWIIGGGLDICKNTQKIKSTKCMLTDLQTTIEKFWTVEELPTQSAFSQEEIECEEHFKKHVSRNKDGQYVVALPFKVSPHEIGESKQTALKRLNGLQKRFENNNEFKIEYSAVIQEYLDLKHMTKLESSQNTEGFYLPHHGVLKDSSSTTKLRVVFNASAKGSKGISLNDTLMVGPTIQNDLFSLLMRFRVYKYVLIADIEKMYRQFFIREEDRKFQKILWYEKQQVQEYQLNTVTFGFAPAAFLAIRCLHQLIEDEGQNFPLAAKILKNDLYVDNLLTGAKTCKQAREIYNQMTQLLSKAQLNMRQWASNEPSILDGVNEKSIDDEFKINKDYMVKTLGVYWKAIDDIFLYRIKLPETSIITTKRTILSEIAKLFDPLGFLGPVILYAKLIMQELWQSKVTWDESIPSAIYHNWINFCTQLEVLKTIQIPRYVLINNDIQSIQLHGFCDASMKGYGACIYVRSENDKGKTQCVLLCSKSRVAPLKTSTIPRLELCGAVLLTNLYQKVIDSLNFNIEKSILWTDSEIVLHWLRANSNSLKTFVSNRVSEIQSKTEINQWRHVPSKSNPADQLSRGQLPNKFINNYIWFQGPSWLIQNEKFWPKFEFETRNDVLPETKQLTCLKVNFETNIFEKFSSFIKLKRVIAFCFRFLPKYRQYKGPLTTTELNHAEIVLLRLAQNFCFQNEIKKLRQNKPLNKQGKFHNLDPFISEDGLLRVGGRLNNADIPFDQQHPIILPQSNCLSELIISHFHITSYHGGQQTTLYAIRQKYWPLNGRNQVKKIIRKCIPCFRAKPKLTDYKMANLPEARVTKVRVFHKVGIDYCGPFMIKERKYRNRNTIKSYICVFVCMSSKAIHIELVGNLSTKGFLGALRRFIARRGKPHSIYCDNGTNFQGARNELNDIYVLVKSENFENDICDYTSQRNIEFHFIPPSSPHFGGLWEAGVKSFKHHLKRVAANSLFTFEEFYTLAVEIESVLNSRPLTPLSTDINDLSALTPGHFLIGDSLTSLPEPDFTPVPSNRLCTWQLISKIRQDFWKRWNVEYLNELNIRKKWCENRENLKKDMLVIVKEDNVPCMQWPLARIHELHPGKDGVVRCVTLRFSNNLLKRPVTKIAVLPIQEKDVE